MDDLPEGTETLRLSLDGLKWIGPQRVQIRATVSHHKAIDPSKPIETEGSSDIYYGNLKLRFSSGKWVVTGVKGGWEQPE